MDIVFGVFIILLGVAGCILALKYKPASVVNQHGISPSQSIFDEIPSSNRKEQLRLASSGQTVTLIGESEKAIHASITLYEMFQRQPHAPWSRTGLVSKVLALAGGIFIFKIPSQEAGKPVWFKGREISSSGLGKFYKGSPDSAGPAKEFHQNDQTKPVPYALPKNLTPGVTWEVVDIGTFDADVEGETDNIISGDRLYFVTSKEQNGENWLIYMDARKGEAKGSGGLFLLEPFEPSVEVSDLM